ncbi:MAG TPA: hypothetical protein VHM92_08980 [Allosphingosinicella sp.]|nr:hypothetical protein [Allosphingosinicella sp.]
MAALLLSSATPVVARPAADAIAQARAAAARAQAAAAQARANGNDAKAAAALARAQDIRAIIKEEIPILRDAKGDPATVRDAVKDLRDAIRALPKPGGGG